MKLRFVAAPKSERSRNLNRNFRWVPAFFLQLKPQLEVSQLKRLRKRPLRKLRSPKRDNEGLSDRPRHASQWGGSCEAADSQSDIKQICRKTPDFIKVIPATPEPKITESGPEPEFRPEFRRNFEPRAPVTRAMHSKRWSSSQPCSSGQTLCVKRG